MRNYKPADLSGIPGAAKHGGYVYVIAFSNEVVKVGKTRHARARLGDHQRNARLFGHALTDCWSSPAHDGWEENEQALIGIAAELGGVALSPEHFTGIDFAAVVAKAGALPFPVPQPLQQETPSRRAPSWLNDEITRFRQHFLPDGWMTEAEATEELTSRIVAAEGGFVREIVARYIRKRLTAGAERPTDADEPEPPEPEPPGADLTVSDVLEQLAKAA